LAKDRYPGANGPGAKENAPPGLEDANAVESNVERTLEEQRRHRAQTEVPAFERH
jgi:hypothetical protein